MVITGNNSSDIRVLSLDFSYVENIMDLWTFMGTSEEKH